MLPFLLAWLFRQNPEWVEGRSNKGELVEPPLTTERSELTGFDSFSSGNMRELKGRWVMVNVIPGVACGDACLDALHKTKQLRLMMNKDLTRIRRVVVLLDEKTDPEIAKIWWQDDPLLLRARPTTGFLSKIDKITQGVEGEGLMILMDPLGNLMMLYRPGFDPYDVQTDLKKLLRISQIG
ncbi:MAG: hypothetical protein ACU826_07140 [Gammaproteobacteria bacterium]